MPIRRCLLHPADDETQEIYPDPLDGPELSSLEQMPEKRSSKIDAKEIALLLIQATSMTGDPRASDPLVPDLPEADYYHIACHLLFRCQRCGTCCTTGDPIKLRPLDAARIARRLKLPLNKFQRKYTRPYSDDGNVLAFKKVQPCRFYDPGRSGCKIYEVRPWSCRIFPFLGVYGSEDRVVVHPTCPGSMEAAKALTETVAEMQKDPEFKPVDDPRIVRAAKRWFDRVLNGID